MSLVSGINHVAILTRELERFVEFYRRVFEVEIVFREVTPAFRHAILRAGSSSWLHPVEVPDNVHGAAVPDMVARGHLDHIALTASSRSASKPSAHVWSMRERATKRSKTSARSTRLGSPIRTGCGVSSA